MREKEKEKSVCVMDASGPLGRALVARLLHRGYTVHAATYQPQPEEQQHHPRLKLFRADPYDYHAIADAVHGCSGLFAIFNTPAPCFEEEEMMVEAEVRAAHNILEACAQTETMERVVFNSSVTAVVWRPEPEERERESALDETSWSDLSFCRRFKLWHALAKTLSEKTAWALAMDRGVDMVAINAGLVTGPGLRLSAANPYLKGAPDMYDHGVLVTVDVDFLADAHIAAYECPTAYGRYLCFNHTVCRPEDAANLAQMLLSPRTPAPPSDELKVIPQMIHTKKLNKLMLEFTSGIYGDIN
uniref:NAD-dependent epimerase/dehydratase domain-containing protein n=1 Tax=Oryza brachyantha TaxID=4533 RepID=J3N574_ORYBR